MSWMWAKKKSTSNPARWRVRKQLMISILASNRVTKASLHQRHSLMIEAGEDLISLIQNETISISGGEVTATPKTVKAVQLSTRSRLGWRAQNGNGRVGKWSRTRTKESFPSFQLRHTFAFLYYLRYSIRIRMEEAIVLAGWRGWGSYESER